MTMLQNKQVLYGILIVGILLVALSLLIDPVRGENFHMAGVQWLVLIVGAVIALIGAYLTFVRKPPVV
jgi:hypothetical protein